MNAISQVLQDIHVIITRPEELAGNLCHLIRQAGGIAISYPVISIEEPLDTKKRDRALASLAEFDLAVFISPTAVRKTFDLIDQLPSGLQITAIGSSSRQSLEDNNIVVNIVSGGQDSEALLGHTDLQADRVSDKNIIIFRGEGGRTLLGDTLVSRGARICYVEMYRRALPAHAPRLTTEQLVNTDVIAVTSNTGLSNLYELCDDRPTLVKIPLVVPGNRTDKLAGEMGFEVIIRAANATDIACLNTLIEWAARRTSTLSR